MKLTKSKLLNKVNKRLVSYNQKWDDVVDEFDSAIEEINTYLSTKYPLISEVLTEDCDPEKTYSYRAGGIDVPFFPNKYITSIVIPFVITRILRVDEEFSNVYIEYKNEYQENLFIMARDEIHHIPKIFMTAPKGVYFPSNDPQYKEDPEAFFNREIIMDIPKIKVTYHWGNLQAGAEDISVFVSKPLPIDNNSYEIGSNYMPVVMTGANFDTLVVDAEENVLGTFIGWSLEKEGDFREIISGQLTLTQDLVLYAVFDYDIIRFKYTGNGGSLKNWKPMYLNKNSIPDPGVIPYGGSATRDGFSFLGFTPIQYTKNEIEALQDGIDELSEYQNETELEFIAQWSLVLYTLTFIGNKTNVNIGRSGYIHGEEFDLIAPEEIPGSPDEFIGWWDNSNFIGDPVTKIYESDLGNKIFYAKYDTDNYRVDWFQEDGTTLIRSDVLTKNSQVEPPNLNDITDIIDDDGLEWRRNFLGFVDQDTGAEPNKVLRNTVYIANYTEMQPVTTNVFVHFNEVIEDVITESIKEMDVQVGTKLYKTSLLSFLNNNRTYLDDVTQKYISDFSLIAINGGAINGDYVQIQQTTVFYAIYETTTHTVTIHKQVFDEGTGTLEVHETYEQEIIVPHGVTKEYIQNIMTLEDEIPVQFEGLYTGILTTYYIDDLVLLLDESIITDPITEDMDLLVTYNAISNESYIKKLTLIGYPISDSKNTTTVEINFTKGTVVDLISDYKDEVNNDSNFLYNHIDHFFTSLTEQGYNNEVINVTMDIDRTIYIQVVDLKVFDLYFKSYNDNGESINIFTKDFYPFEIESCLILNPFGTVPCYTVNGTDLQNFENPTHPTNPINKKFIGWNTDETDASNGIVDNSEGIKEEDVTDIIYFYPVFKDVQGYQINLSFKNNHETLLTQYTRGETFNVTFEATEENKTKLLFNNFNEVLSFINGTTSRTLQQYGYILNGYYLNGIFKSIDQFPIYINLPSATSEVQEFNLEFDFLRDSDWALVTLRSKLIDCGDSSDNDPVSMNGNAYEHLAINESWNYKFFVLKGMTYKDSQHPGQNWISFTPKLIYPGSLLFLDSYYPFDGTVMTIRPDGRRYSFCRNYGCWIVESQYGALEDDLYIYLKIFD